MQMSRLSLPGHCVQNATITESDQEGGYCAPDRASHEEKTDRLLLLADCDVIVSDHIDIRCVCLATTHTHAQHYNAVRPCTLLNMLFSSN